MKRQKKGIRFTRKWGRVMTIHNFGCNEIPLAPFEKGEFDSCTGRSMGVDTFYVGDIFLALAIENNTDPVTDPVSDPVSDPVADMGYSMMVDTFVNDEIPFAPFEKGEFELLTRLKWLSGNSGRPFRAARSTTEEKKEVRKEGSGHDRRHFLSRVSDYSAITLNDK